jgi:hypothetical protein
MRVAFAVQFDIRPHLRLMHTRCVFFWVAVSAASINEAF